MASDLDDIIVEAIVVQDHVPDAPSFDTALLLGYHTAWTDSVRPYSQAKDMLSDGFLVTDDLYLMAVAFKAQPNAPANFKVGRLRSVFTQIVSLIPMVTTQGYVYKGGAVNGKSWTYTVPGSATIATICTAIAALINGLSAGTTASGASTTAVICTAGTPGKIISFVPGTGIKMLDTTADAGFNADIAALQADDDAWYGLVLQTTSKAYNEAAGIWTEANGKIFLEQSADWNIADATVTSGDVGSDQLATALTRTWGIWHNFLGGTEWAAAAWMASTLSFQPGNADTAFKTLATISADKLSAGQIAGIKAKKWSRYMSQGGSPITYRGYTPSGRFIDVTRFVDWLRITVQLDAYAVFLNNPKVPYTASGISQIKGAIQGSLKKGQTAPNNGLSTDIDPVVTIPAVAQQAPSDRANRLLNSITYSARLSGSLQSLNITGTLSV
jgi:hypothetical protein